MKRLLSAIICFICLLMTMPLAAELQVIAVSPQGRTEGVDATKAINITFNQPVATLEKIKADFQVKEFSIRPELKGKFQWQGTATLSFIPAQQLPLATQFTVILSKGFTSAVSGDVLNKDYSWAFETLRPDLRFSFPYHQSDWMRLNTKIFLAFNQPMDPAKAAKSIQISENGPGGVRGIEFDIRNKLDTERISDEKDDESYGFDYRLSYSTSSYVLVLKPKEPLRRDCSYSLKLIQDLPAAEGNLGLLADREIAFKTYKTFKFVREKQWDAVEPGSGLRICFTNPVKYSDLVKMIKVDPVLDFSRFKDSNYYSNGDSFLQYAPMFFDLQLKPSLRYQVWISSELTDKFGQKLTGDIKDSFTTTDFSPRIFMPTGIGIVESYLEPLAHPINVLNIDRLRLKMGLVTVNDIIPLINNLSKGNDDWDMPLPGGYQVDRDFETKTRKNIRTLKPINFSEVLKDRKRGIIFLQVDPYAELIDHIRYRHALLQITTIGITAKFSPYGGLVYVSTLKNSLPVPDCEIEIRDEQNKILFTGVSNEKGLLATPSWEDLKLNSANRWSAPEFWIIARKDDDLSFISSGGHGIYPYSFNIQYSWMGEYPEYKGHIFTERGIYRPGETVHIKGIVRERRLNRWEMPRIREYVLKINDSRGKGTEQSITLSELGSFDFDYQLEKSSPTGYYNILITEKSLSPAMPLEQQTDSGKIRMSGTFRVEEYKPATFEVEMSFDRKDYQIKDTVNSIISARYLFGAPMEGAEVKYYFRMQRDWYHNEDYPGYIFSGDIWDSEYARERGNLLSGQAKLEKDGAFKVQIPLKSGGSAGLMKLIGEGTVISPDRQVLSGRASVQINGSTYYIGLKPETTFVEKGKSAVIQLITVTSNDGKPVDGKKINCRLAKVEWNSALKAEVGGRLEWRTEKTEVEISSFTVTTTLEPYKWQWQPGKAGYYQFQAQGTDELENKVNSSTYFYVTGQDYCAWERSDDDRIELICDKTSYKPGETAKIMVKSPFEAARALITLEREGIIDYFQQVIKGSADTISIPITEKLLPNIYVSVILYRGREGRPIFAKDSGDDLDKPSFKIGYTNLIVDTGSKHLNLAVSADKKEYRPREKVSILIKATNQSGQAVSGAEITVAAVDLGILNLISYATPNPFPYFYGPRWLSVSTAESRLHVIGQRNYGEKGENRGGGGGLESVFDIRTKLMPTAYWNPRVMTDDKGEANLSFELPDNLTTFRIMATGQTRDSCFGCGETKIIVNKPLVLKPSMPRFVRVGDRFKAGILCHNNTGNKGLFTLTMESSGLKLLDAANKKEVMIESGEAKELQFDFYASSVTTAEFVFYGTLGAEKDAFTWSIPVHLERTRETVATYGTTFDQSTEAIKIPKNIYEDSSSLKFSLASTALLGLEGGLEYLFNYPYGCLEQRTSKILPVIIARDFIEKFGLAPGKARDSRSLVNEYLKGLPDFQDSSGGFVFWPNGGIPSPYLTSYVLWVIAMAQKDGYTVDGQMIKKAGDFLSSYVRNQGQAWSWPYNLNCRLTTDAFALYALSLHNYHEQSLINNLYQKLDQMPLFGKIYLLKALNQEKMSRGMIDKVATEITNKIKVSPTDAHYEESDDRGMEWIWHSNVRTTAAILQGLLEVNGQYPMAEKIVRWLATERKSGRWLTTQENIYVFHAFQEYVRHYENETPDFIASVVLDSKEIARETFSGRELKAKDTTLPVTSLPKDTKLLTKFSKQGVGRLYYVLSMTYAPLGELPAIDNGMQVTREIESFKNSRISGRSYYLNNRYKVTLKVKTDQERHFVVLNDPIPAGFEVVDLSFATESRLDQDTVNSSMKNYRWWGSFDHWENYDDRVLLFANYLVRGEHSYSYLIQAVSPGEYEAPAAFVEEMYNPAVFGRTSGSRILVK